MIFGLRFSATLSIVLLGPLSFLAGCYRPSIESGGFKCATGNVCPDGFHCVTSNNRCYQGDAGPEAPACALPVVKATCTAEPASGQECNPACQGCACGRCNVVNGTAVCNRTAGAKDVNEICDLAADDCKAGLYCQPECNTPGFGRCYQFCSTAMDCPAGISCSTAARDQSTSQQTTFKVCDLEPQSCDPIGQTGCPSSPSSGDILGCYYSYFGKSYCDCKGTIPTGMSCSTNNSCAPGETCLQLSGKTQCVQLCPLSGGTCAAAASCVTVGDLTYGYCSPI
jgi:hypothetical protein